MNAVLPVNRNSMQASVNRFALVGLAATLFHSPTWSALPTPVPPSTAPAAGDWIGLIQGYIRDGGLVLGLAIAVLGFLWVAYLGFAKFNEARQGKAEWAEVGVLGIVGAVVLIFASYLLTEAAGVI
ncbi:TIGR03745 family integrating conjugative element membrane protein [Pseudomaricurvus alkylphenolicus]|uniref:TIGR03745 family integrating conjugative element membrane protein n=1 Tax=Pseudomaricurvus alkylphenolicus TaxID=1306991 RepID=UPI00141F1DBE|nr:TIGR03745 family integrating conjugative element membrane protein [Pseudomaricurvus alkylphenolicus]NIB44047.1 TIGR03745 family integrating conjugative element membrane protein [Pseudomaricurvus alkylphenolicus]